MKERGEGDGTKRARCTARSPPLLLLPPPPPLVQADGTKSIMYKDVKRNGSGMPDGVRDEWGRRGWNGRSRARTVGRGTMGHAGRKDNNKKEVGAGGAVRCMELRGRADASGQREKRITREGERKRDGETEYLRPTMCKVAALV